MPKERHPLGRGKNLAAALAKIAKDRDLRVASLDEYEDVRAVSTGNLAIDAITAVGGLPRGRIVELYGPPSSGKTTTALQTAAAAQREGGTILYLDYEHALDPEYASALGLDVSSETFLFAQPETFEQGMNAARELIETGDLDVVIVDSVAAMVLEKELSIETGGSTFADKAKLMAQAMRQLTPIVKRHDVVLIFLNHLQDVIDSSPMGQRLSAQGVKRTTTPGGRALKYHASMRIEYRPVGNVRTSEFNPVMNEKEDVPTQTKVSVTVTKNKVGPPFRTCLVRVRFGKGFSQAWTVQDLLVRYRVLKKGTGGVFTFDEDTAPPGWDPKKTLRGEENLILRMESDPEWLAHLTAIAKKLLEEHSHPVEEVVSAEQDDPELEELFQT